jgi:hypothetical protein
VPHAIPASCGGSEGSPSAHVAWTHGFVVAGTSLLSTSSNTSPLPSHAVTLQSPAVCVSTAVPRGTGVSLHAPLSHVPVEHAVCGQSLSDAHCCGSLLQAARASAATIAARVTDAPRFRTCLRDTSDLLVVESSATHAPMTAAIRLTADDANDNPHRPSETSV